MKQLIKKIEFDQFLNRFGEFSDSLIRSVNLRFNRDGGAEIDISISARDLFKQKEGDGEGWVCVVISVEGLTEMAIHESKKTTIGLISFGIHLFEFNGEVGVEFGGQIEPIETIEDLRKSDAFAIGKTLSFEVFPY